MPYAPTTWVDGVTPVNAANLNKLEVGLQNAVGVPADTVVAFNAFLLRNELAGADTQPAFRLMGDGKIEWGPGGSTAPDTALYRVSPGLLYTGGGLTMAGTLSLGGLVWMEAASYVAHWGAASGFQVFRFRATGDANHRFMLSNGGRLDWGDGTAATDTNLYRVGAGNLQTDGAFIVGGPVGVDKAGAGAALYFGAASDVSFSRAGAGQMALQGGLLWVANRPNATDIAFQTGPPTGLGFYFTAAGSMNWAAPGSAADTNLYRSAADQLKTDDTLVIGGYLDIQTFSGVGSGSVGLYFSGLPTNGTGFITVAKRQGDANWRLMVTTAGAISWGDGTAAPDTNLYRAGADALRTDDAFSINRTNDYDTAFGTKAAADALYRFRMSAGGGMEWGPGASGAVDTNLYRAGADILKTDDTFWAAAVVTQVGAAGQVAINPDGKIYFGSAADTNLYRSAADTLKTDDIFISALGLYTFGDATARGGAATQVSFGNLAGNAGIQFGSAADTNLYRVAANALRTDGALVVMGTLWASGISGITSPVSGLVKVDALADAAIGTAFPSVTAADDGRMFTLVDSLTAPTYAWMFRYVAGIADAYKWVFIGGGPWVISVDTSQATASASFVDLTTVGPTATIPRSGEYLVHYEAQHINGSGTAGAIYIGLNINAVSPLATDQAFMLSVTGAGQAVEDHISALSKKTLTAAQVIKMQYRSTSATNQSFSNRRMVITPIRCS